MKPTLLVLAAGMGSRYGGLKQLDGVGPQGQTIMDYSIYDAVKSGFGKVVFVIRRDFADEFRTKIASKYRDLVDVEIVFQDIDALPRGFVRPEGRQRPWGTNHAVLAAKNVINEPFAVINSDDFYGRDAFRVLAEHLAALPADSKGRYAMVAFKAGNTTTGNGEVSRGICRVDQNGRLAKVVERHHITSIDDSIVRYMDEKGQWVETHAATPVSMNFWGFTPDYFEFSEREFVRFLDKYVNEAGREFFIPSVVDKLIGNKEAYVDVLTTDSQWFGVTYGDDRQGVCERLNKLHADGVYPDNMPAPGSAEQSSEK